MFFLLVFSEILRDIRRYDILLQQLSPVYSRKIGALLNGVKGCLYGSDLMVFL